MRGADNPQRSSVRIRIRESASPRSFFLSKPSSRSRYMDIKTLNIKCLLGKQIGGILLVAVRKSQMSGFGNGINRSVFTNKDEVDIL